MSKLKTQLYSLCLHYVEQRIETAQKAITEAQDAANDETKSSAGDKYETGRAMAQLEIEKNASQLAEAGKLKNTLALINPAIRTDFVQIGSLVLTNQGNFYLSISAGQFKIEDQVYFAISAASPIGLKLIGLKSKDQFSFNNKTYQIQEIL